MTPHDENQTLQATEALQNFIKIFAKNYPLVFKDGVYSAKLKASNDKSFPYQVTIEIKKK
jgi:hypothetical protein